MRAVGSRCHDNRSGIGKFCRACGGPTFWAAKLARSAAAARVKFHELPFEPSRISRKTHRPFCPRRNVLCEKPPRGKVGHAFAATCLKRKIESSKNEQPTAPRKRPHTCSAGARRCLEGANFCVLSQCPAPNADQVRLSTNGGPISTTFFESRGGQEIVIDKEETAPWADSYAEMMAQCRGWCGATNDRYRRMLRDAIAAFWGLAAFVCAVRQLSR